MASDASLVTARRARTHLSALLLLLITVCRFDASIRLSQHAGDDALPLDDLPQTFDKGAAALAELALAKAEEDAANDLPGDAALCGEAWWWRPSVGGREREVDGARRDPVREKRRAAGAMAVAVLAGW
ncbi:hypothetical protein VTN02DRAFT_1417 [Thermoascus thermophilus]